MNKHINVGLFVPHAGCPHQCSFCNQKTISGSVKPLTAEDVDEACRIAIESGKTDYKTSEIAFFGGSFTAIDEEYMVSLLRTAKKYIDKKYFKGVRISTRPDCIDTAKLEILKKYGVTSIELGAQSTDDRVLFLNKRGHTAADIENASILIKENGFELGLQMMTGLLGSNDAKDIATAEKIISLKPDTVRIYPTIVLENTPLAEEMKNGAYVPQTLEDAVKLCTTLLEMFEQANINVIRLGLHSGGNVEEGYLAGAYHPAFRELCEGELFLRKMLSQLDGKDKNGKYVIEVADTSLSKAKGQLKRNEKALKNQGFCCIIKGNDFLEKFDIIVKEN